MAHPSPLPWRVVDQVKIADAEGNIVAVCRQAKPMNTMIAMENARLICEAVNRTPETPKEIER
jgi:hypothetical protein